MATEAAQHQGSTAATAHRYVLLRKSAALWRPRRALDEPFALQPPVDNQDDEGTWGIIDDVEIVLKRYAPLGLELIPEGRTGDLLPEELKSLSLRVSDLHASEVVAGVDARWSPSGGFRQRVVDRRALAQCRQGGQYRCRCHRPRAAAHARGLLKMLARSHLAHGPSNTADQLRGPRRLAFADLVSCIRLFDRAPYKSFLNSSGVSPASWAMAPIVKALTGLCRGTVRIRWPSDITMCLPSRTTGTRPSLMPARPEGEGPQVSSALWDGYLDLPNLGAFGLLLNHRKVLLNGRADVLQSFTFSIPLGVAAWKARNGSRYALFGPLKDDFVPHAIASLVNTTALGDAPTRKLSTLRTASCPAGHSRGGTG